MNDYDDLDRAIFELDLAEPPAGLRESILRSTIYAAVEPSLALASREIALVGIALALGVFLSIYALADHAFATTLTNVALDIARALAEPMTLSWLVAGGAVALVAQSLQGRALRLPIRIPRP